MRDWANKSNSNKEKLIQLSDELKLEANDKGYEKLKWIAKEAIDEDILGR